MWLSYCHSRSISDPLHHGVIRVQWPAILEGLVGTRGNECQHAGILCRSGDPSRIVPNRQGDCLSSTNALDRVWSQSPPPPICSLLELHSLLLR